MESSTECKNQIILNEYNWNILINNNLFVVETDLKINEFLIAAQTGES